jgi:hypothetical protein
MPTINGKKYAYTKLGIKKAAAAKLRNKKKIVRRKKK